MLVEIPEETLVMVDTLIEQFKEDTGKVASRTDMIKVIILLQFERMFG